MNFTGLRLFNFSSLLKEASSYLLLTVVVVAALFPGRLNALESIGSVDQYQLPADMSGVQFYLITVDVGDMVWDNFGHTALRVVDEKSDIDVVFNWGGFDVSGGVVAFSFNFFKGIMNYSLGTNSSRREFAIYQYQQRTLWQDEINLTNPQKEILYRRLLWNMEVENVVYPYQYFFDNCTTKVRDYLNEALSGRIAAENTGITQNTFRDQVLQHYESVALIGFSLDILMNSNIDRPVTEWEEMFLPLSLRERLFKVESDVAENGERKMLLSNSQLIMQFPPPSVETDAYQVASISLLAPVLLLLLMLKKIPMSYFATHSRISLKAANISFRVLGLLGLITALFSGVYGVLMLGSWFISDHLDLHHNINLLLFWPTDFLGLLVALRWFVFCRPWPMTHNSTPFINYYLMAHVAGMIAYAGITFLELSAQSTLNIALYIVPGFLAFTLMIWLVGFEPAKPRSDFF
ncbi:MAG: hypothetical protein COA96_05795 [SAR86 cluster bacterium]|uniref:Lnb N-terminal periplasmic domain-containing protein n=1 Tax=SAR86 cluster bacterium TaxID=2030880 RepID=A0A2A5B3V5_9GAMM|nr:MAG: hypothetical protein COA96_05795 [SAR86 cluster bacterium]